MGLTVIEPCAVTGVGVGNSDVVEVGVVVGDEVVGDDVVCGEVVEGAGVPPLPDWMTVKVAEAESPLGPLL